MTVRYHLLMAFLFGVVFVCAQGNSGATNEQFVKDYQKRISKEYLNRVYIPVDLADAFNQLNLLIDDTSKKKFMAVNEEEAARKLHFSLGRWIMVNWGFYEGSRLSHYLKGLGISYPDDMARFIILTYHRNLTNKKLEVKPLLDEMIKRRAEEFEEKKKQGEVLFEEKRKLPKPDSIKQ